jgi:hypothetical protein
MLVSTFELLVKPQFPNPSVPGSLTGAPPLNPPLPAEIADLSRVVIAAYFLTVANLNSFEVAVNLQLTARLASPSTFDNFLDAVDLAGSNVNLISKPTVTPTNPPVPGVSEAVLKLNLPPRDTALIVIQPDFVNHPELLTNANFEARGFVEIFAFGGSSGGQLLLTAQTRGTFFKKLADSAAAIDFGLDQIAYDIPVQNNGIVPVTRSVFIPKSPEAIPLEA